MDSGFGISANKAYKELLAEKNTNCIVAMIDAGVDYHHEYLKDVVWNNKREIAEYVDQHKFTDKEQAARIVFEYIEIWYNRKRLHAALGYLFREEFGENLNKQNIAT